MKHEKQQPRSPLPWCIGGRGNLVESATGTYVLNDDDINDMDAAFIVRAVNSHAVLLSALLKLNCFCNDLSANNPGFLGKLVIQDYAQWNEAFMEAETVLRELGYDARATDHEKAIAAAEGKA